MATTPAIPPADMTLDELKEALAMAAPELGVPPERARIAFPGGAVEMIDAWFDWVDRSMLLAFPPERIAAMKIRERIGELILFRFQLLRPHREALRRALATLAMPQNAVAAGRLAWRSADRIWRTAGDTATDYNHYTKRAILISVYGSTSFVFLDDESEDMAATRAFLARRIDDVMKFEKAKAQFTARSARRPSLSRFLGRLRYPN